MSRNVALRNRARQEHDEKRGGRSAKSAVVSVEVVSRLPPAGAAEKARGAIREVTGIDIAAGDGGERPLDFFSELAVDMDVEPRSEGSGVRVALRISPRNTGIAILLLSLAVLSIVGVVVVALRAREKPKKRARLDAMARQIEALLRG